MTAPTTTVPPALVAEASAVFDVPAAEILSASRRESACHARHAIAWALRHEGGWQLTEIARALGRHHSTICQGLQALESQATRNARLALQISALLRR